MFIFFKSLFILSFVLTIRASESEISKLFLRTFTEKDIFNVTSFDEIYPLIKHNSNKWISNLRLANFSHNCLLVKNSSTTGPSKLIDISSTESRNLLNSYLYRKFLEPPCANVDTVIRQRRFTVTEVWLYGFLTVTFINIFAVLGILFSPLVKKKIYKSLMTFMVSLAVGSLAGTAILILIPDSMKVSEMAIHGGFNKNDYKWKATVAFAGLYFFFLTERLFKTLIYRNNKCGGEPRNSVALDGISNHIHHHVHGPVKENEDNGKQVTENKIVSSLKEVTKRIEPVAWMIIFGDAMHNFVDGLSIGAAFSFDVMSGVSVSVAIMCEELPHELGDFAVLVSSGMTFKEAIFWNSMSAMTCYLGFIIGVIVGEVTSASVWIFSIAGGMFLYISLVDMMNDIISTLDNMQCSRSKKLITFALQNLGLWTGYSIILIVALYGDQIQFGG